MKICEKFGFPATLPDVDDVVLVEWVDPINGALCCVGTRVRAIHYYTSSELQFFLDVSVDEVDFNAFFYERNEKLFYLFLSPDRAERLQAKVTFY